MNNWEGRGSGRSIKVVYHHNIMLERQTTKQLQNILFPDGVSNPGPPEAELSTTLSRHSVLMLALSAYIILLAFLSEIKITKSVMRATASVV
jgi:hypothetical protein